MCGPATVTIRFRLAWWARHLLRVSVCFAPLARRLPKWLRERLALRLAKLIAEGLQIVK